MDNILKEVQKTLDECVRIARMNNDEYLAKVNREIELDGKKYKIENAFAAKVGSLKALTEYAKDCIDIYIKEKEGTWH